MSQYSHGIRESCAEAFPEQQLLYVGSEIESMQQNGIWVQKSELMARKNEAHLNICIGIKDRVATGLRVLVCVKGTVPWKIIPSPNKVVQTISISVKAVNRELGSCRIDIYGINTPFSSYLVQLTLGRIDFAIVKWLHLLICLQKN